MSFTSVKANTIRYANQQGTSENGCLNWDDACDAQTALLRAQSGDQVWVAHGTYTPNRNFPQYNYFTFDMKDNVKMYGGFRGTETRLDQRPGWLTILSGDVLGDDGPFFIQDFVACYSSWEVPYEDNCDHFDYDFDGDVDSFDFRDFLVVNNHEDNDRHVVSAQQVNTTALLDGFTITGGINDDDDNDHYGGGMFTHESHLTVRNCKFIGNGTHRGYGFGGGLYIGYDSNMKVINCTFEGNFGVGGGGIAIEHNSAPIIENCIIDGNVSPGWGGGIIIRSSNVVSTINNTIISNNRAGLDGGGMETQFDEGGSVSLNNCTFYNNISPWKAGGAIVDGDASEIIGCIFYSNTSYQGGGIFLRGGNLTIDKCIFKDNIAGNSPTGGLGWGGAIMTAGTGTLSVTNSLFVDNKAFSLGGALVSIALLDMANCTLYGNYAPLAGGIGIVGNATISNTILWNNMHDQEDGYIQWAQLIGSETSVIDINYSCVEEWDGFFGGEGNMGDDPLLSNNMHLTEGSPAIDRGNNELVPEGIYFDLDNEYRFVHNVDMGCYEHLSSELCVADLNSDNKVDAYDLAILLGHWGACDGCIEDINDDGVANVYDLQILLTEWGECY